VIAFPYNRGKVLRAVYILMLLACGVWYARVMQPAERELESRNRIAAEREARVRTGRTAAVVVGPAGLDSLLQRFKADSALLYARFPTSSTAAISGDAVKQVLSATQRRPALRVASTEPLPTTPEGPFEGTGSRVRVVGPYSEIADLLSELGSLVRVTRVRGFQLHAIPDSLVRAAEPYNQADAIPAADSSGLAAALADAGESPFKAVATFDLLWFSLPAEEAGSDLLTTQRPGAAAPLP
jgi:Tfp pilus assembly protein PilO